MHMKLADQFALSRLCTRDVMHLSRRLLVDLHRRISEPVFQLEERILMPWFPQPLNIRLHQLAKWRCHFKQVWQELVKVSHHSYKHA